MTGHSTNPSNTTKNKLNGRKELERNSVLHNNTIGQNPTKKFIVDTGSPVTLIPKLKFNKITAVKPVSEDYRDVNDNKIKFEGKPLAIRNRR